jgi:hypothetical protein
MPQQRLKSSQMMMIGAKVVAILEVPNGCTPKRTTRMAHVDPTMVLDEMLGWATSIP